MAFKVTDRKDWVVHVLRPAGRLCLSPFFRVCIRGLDRLPATSAFVLLVKHQRWEDIPLLGLSVPQPLFYVAKVELFRVAPVRWLLASLGGIPLNRQRPLESRRFLKRIVEHLQQGEGVVIFPEGTYHRDRMGPGRVGLVRMVLSKATPPFVPVGVRYRRRVRTSVEIRFGRPSFPEPSEDPQSFLDRMMMEIARLSGLFGERGKSIGTQEA